MHHTQPETCQFGTPHVEPHACAGCGQGHDPVEVECPSPQHCAETTFYLRSSRGQRVRREIEYGMFDAYFDAVSERRDG